MRRHIKCLTYEERESERLRIEALCQCCCKEPATIKTGEADVQQVCAECASKYLRDVPDKELMGVLLEVARGLDVTYVATDTGRVTEIKPSRRAISNTTNDKPN